MRKLSIHLPISYRLDFQLVKTRPDFSVRKSLHLYLNELRSIRNGNKISRLFRHIFEHNKIRGILGTNIAVMILASSFIPKTDSLAVEAENNIVSANVVLVSTERGIAYPVSLVKITQGYRIFHPGIDFDGLTGDPVTAVMPGTVSHIQYSRYAYGNAVIIDHGKGITSLYAHLSKIEVQVDQKVDTFTELGEMGATGRAFGDHLHLEIRENEKPMNPLSILPKI